MNELLSYNDLIGDITMILPDGKKVILEDCYSATVTGETIFYPYKNQRKISIEFNHMIIKDNSTNELNIATVEEFEDLFGGNEYDGKNI